MNNTHLDEKTFIQLKNYVSIETDVPLEIAAVILWAQVVFLGAASRIVASAEYTWDEQVHGLSKAHVAMLGTLAEHINLDVRKMKAADELAYFEVLKSLGVKVPYAP